MVLRTVLILCLTSAAVLVSSEAANATNRRKVQTERQKQASRVLPQKLVTTVPCSLSVELDAYAGSSQALSAKKSEGPMIPSIPSPSVTIGSKEVSMSPWMPVRHSLGVQMELVW